MTHDGVALKHQVLCTRYVGNKKMSYDFSARIVSKLDATLNCLSCGYRNRALDPTAI